MPGLTGSSSGKVSAEEGSSLIVTSGALPELPTFWLIDVGIGSPCRFTVGGTNATAGGGEGAVLSWEFPTGEISTMLLVLIGEGV